MGHAAELTGFAVVALSALIGGMVMARFRQPPMVGYILAGVALGPSGLGLVESREHVAVMAELGILLLLFLIGMELSVRAFLAYIRLAMTAVALQVAASVLVILACSQLLGFSLSLSILLGFVVALSSTAVAIKMMEETGELRTRVGRVAVAVLIAQDLAFLPMLLIVQNLGDGEFGFAAVARIAFAVGLLGALMWALNRRRRINLPFARIVIGHADLSPLTGLVYCFGAGALFGLFGMSAAYGAFLAGLIVGKSAQRQQMINSVRPIQSILVMVFFLSIGLLIDLGYIADNIGTVLALLLVVTLFKTALNVGILRFLGEQWQRAFLQGVLISQLGEFSFLLAAVGFATGAIGEADLRLVISVTALSLVLSPFWLITARRFHNIARNVSSLRETLDAAYGEEAAAMREGSNRIVRSLGDIVHRLRTEIPIPGARRGAAEPLEEPPEDPVRELSTAEIMAEIGDTVGSAARNQAARVGGDALSSPDDDPVPGKKTPVGA
jgi:CPA2 family monovalent cation:H+ antiporter-2